MTSIVVRLDVGVSERHLQTFDDWGHVVLGRVGESLGQNISCRDVDGLLEQVVFKDDESSINLRRVTHDEIPVVQHLVDVDTTARNTPVCERINTNA